MATTLTPIRISLKDAREAKGMTQSELAEAAGVRQATISEMETGLVRRVSLDVLERLCNVLEVAPGDLLELDPPKKRRR
jgi:putative transcriptional regulator